jgi:PPE-repeat protein
VLDFGALPPEINSSRIYLGPGSGSMMAAAAAWDGLAAELGSTATGYTSVITELTGSPWLGPASRSMVSAVTPYIAWISTAAALAEQSGNQARAAAAAFEAAFAQTVPPPVIAANRALLLTLIATNFFGQNTPAIAATEAQYAEMWAQDAVAMYGYASSSASATQLVPFAEPAQSTDQAGLAAQSSAVNQALAIPASTSVPAAASAAPGLAVTPDVISITSIFTSINQTLQQILSGATAAGLNPNGWFIVQQLGTFTASIRTTMARSYETSYFDLGFAANPISILQQVATGPGGATAGAGGSWYATPQFAGLHLGALGSVGGHTTGAVSANLASSTKIGGLSVPANWAGSPGAMEESAATKAMAVDYVTDPQGDASGLLRGIPLGGGGGRRAAGALPPREYGFKRSVLARPPSAG